MSEFHKTWRHFKNVKEIFFYEISPFLIKFLKRFQNFLRNKVISKIKICKSKFILMISTWCHYFILEYFVLIHGDSFSTLFSLNFHRKFAFQMQKKLIKITDFQVRKGVTRPRHRWQNSKVNYLFQRTKLGQVTKKMTGTADWNRKKFVQSFRILHKNYLFEITPFSLYRPVFSNKWWVR